MRLEQWWIVWKSGYKNQATVTTERPFTYNATVEHVVPYSSYEKACFDRDAYVARIAELEKQIEKAEKVVEFYGAKENWRDEADSGVKVFGPFKDHKTWTDCGYEYDWENLNDQGEKAREYFADKDKK